MAQARSETVVVAAEEAGERLDRLLATRVAELSRSRHKSLILAGRVTIDGATIRDPGHKVNAGGTIDLQLPPPEDGAVGAENIPLEVAYEDDDIIVIDKPIDRHPHAREKMAVREGGRRAVTHWQVLERYADARGAPVASLVECQLETGRTHQIRVHLAAIGHPLMGDAVYGGGFRTRGNRLSPQAQSALGGLGRQALHAYLLIFEHPVRGNVLEFRSELPGDLSRLHHSLGARGISLSKDA